MKEAAQRKVCELEQQLADALAAVAATRAEAEAALSAEVNMREQIVHNLKLESFAKETELTKTLAETRAALDSHSQELVKSKAECDAVSKTLSTLRVDREAKVTSLVQQLTEANEALVASTVLGPSDSGPSFAARLPPKCHDACKAEVTRLQKCIDSRDEAVALLEHERDKAMKSLARELSDASRRMKQQRTPVHDGITTTALGAWISADAINASSLSLTGCLGRVCVFCSVTVAPAPSVAPSSLEIKALQAEVLRLQNVIVALESKEQTPVRAARPSHVIADVSTPASAVLSPDTESMLLSPTDGNTSLSDASPAGVRLAEVVLQEIKLADAKAELSESSKSLSGVKNKIRTWMNEFEAREGRKAEKVDKKAIRDDFVQLRELEQKVHDVESTVSDTTMLLDKMRSQYQLREPEVVPRADFSPLPLDN
jgi:hypothetical protein